MKGCVVMKKKTIMTMTDAEMTKAFRLAVKKSIAENKAKGNLVCGYDKEKRKSYILYPDGHKEYA